MVFKCTYAVFRCPVFGRSLYYKHSYTRQINFWNWPSPNSPTIQIPHWFSNGKISFGGHLCRRPVYLVRISNGPVIRFRGPGFNRPFKYRSTVVRSLNHHVVKYYSKSLHLKLVISSLFHYKKVDHVCRPDNCGAH
jgi:hypothetical protein